MTRRGQTLLKGHTLQSEGMGFDKTGTRGGFGKDYRHAVCSCGAVSPPLPSIRARQQWHRDHKDSLR